MCVCCLQIACPHKPLAPALSEQPSFKQASVLIAWDKPPKTGKELDEMDDIKSYRSQNILFYHVLFKFTYYSLV